MSYQKGTEDTMLYNSWSTLSMVYPYCDVWNTAYILIMVNHVSMVTTRGHFYGQHRIYWNVPEIKM